jgi:hypothetical protein
LPKVNGSLLYRKHGGSYTCTGDNGFGEPSRESIVVLVKRKWQHKNTTKFNSETSTSTNVVFSAADVPVLYPSQAYVEDELTGLPARLELVCVVQVTFLYSLLTMFSYWTCLCT